MRNKLLCAAMLALALCALLAAAVHAEDAFAWDEASATQIMLGGDTISISGDGAAISGSTVTISRAGAYVLSGTLSDGQIIVDAGKNDVVRLVLDGVSLHSSTTSPLYIIQADEVILILADGAENLVSDADAYVFAEGEDEPDAAIFSKKDMVIGGGGKLTVLGNYRNGIATKDDLTIAGGTIAVTAVHDGIRGRDSITIDGGTIAVTASNDGLKANNDGGEDKGWIEVNAGTLEIASGHDGIQAETDLTVNGGTIMVVAGGGSVNAASRSQSQWGGRGVSTTVVTTDDDDADSTSYKGLKAGMSLTVAGGTLTLDTADDALHTNGSMTITGGDITIATGDDGAHADDALLIEGGSILITACYEGLEGATVTIAGGDMHITASDDGINAAGGSDGEAGPWGMDRFGGSGDYWIEISGGTIWISAGGDGIDSNGSLTISGGMVTVGGPTNSGNGALDGDGGVVVTGGTLIAADVGGMSQTPGAGTTQPYVAATLNSLTAGETVTLADAAGQVLATYTVEKTGYRMVMFSLPGLVEGGAYTVSASGGASAQATATTSGGGGMGGMGGFGGGGRGGNMQQPDQGQSPTQQQPRGRK